MAHAPMPPLEKRAWWSLVIGVAMFVTITAILVVQGAAVYWENDNLRTLVLTIFLGGLIGYVGVLASSLPKEREGRVDERDRLILSRAPKVQSALVLIALAAWLVALTRMFHDEGAVPVVYLYLMFGCIIIITIIGQALGILFGYWMVARYGEG